MCITLSQHHAALTSYVVSGYHCSSSALYVPCFVWLSITMLSQVLHLSITPLMCLALSQHDITPLFSALPFPLDIFQATRSIAPRCYKVVQ